MLRRPGDRDRAAADAVSRSAQQVWAPPVTDPTLAPTTDPTSARTSDPTTDHPRAPGAGQPTPRRSDVAQEPAPGRAPVLTTLRTHPVLTTASVLGTVALAVLVAWVQPVTHTAEARLAVAGGDLAAQAVPGYALASQELAANYARYVNNSDDQGSLEEEIGADAGSISSVTASPVPESNVVRIVVDAADPATATAAARRLAETLIARVAAASTEEEAATVLEEFTAISTAVAEAEQDAARAQAEVGAAAAGAPGDVEALRAAAARAAADLSVLRVQQEALGQRYRTLVDTISSVDLTVVEPAEITGDDRAARAQRYALAGVLAGLLAAYALAGRRRRRRAAAGFDALLAAPAPRDDPRLAGVGPARR